MPKTLSVRSLMLSILLLTVTSAIAATADSATPAPGTLETVAELPINPGNLAVTAAGRVFATVHQFRPAAAGLIEITGPTDWRPWPNEHWNDPQGSGLGVLNSVLGIGIDRQGRLWVLDNGLGPVKHQPKLLAFDLNSGEMVYRYPFPPETGPLGSFLNDLAIDDQRGFVYIADIGGDAEPALVVVDLKTDRSRRFSATKTLRAEDVDLIIDGRTITAPGSDQPARVGVNPITLSADGETLYFGAMHGTTWYQVPARLLRDGAEDAAIAAAITKAGPKPVSDGASTDRAGNHYFTNLANDAITVLHPDGRLDTLVQDSRLSWPDALSFGEPGWLYIAVNQLHLAPPLNQGKESSEPPYRIMRVYTGSDGIAGR